VKRLENGLWEVDIELLPEFMRHRTDLATVAHTHDLLQAHALETLRWEWTHLPTLRRGLSQDLYVEKEFKNMSFRYRLAMEESEGSWGSELRDARMIRREDHKRATLARKARNKGGAA
jgi:hypothetical protein